MYEDLAPRMADVLTAYSVPVQKGDYVGIVASTAAEPLIVALYEAVLRRGGNPSVHAMLPGLSDLYYRLADEHQLDFMDPVPYYAIGEYDVLYQIIASTNKKAQTSIDPQRVARSQKANRPYIERYFERIEDKSLRWNICAWPTQAAAQEAEMSLLAYTEFIYNACGLNHADPVGYWEGVKTRQQKLVEWLADKSHGHYTGPGIDITFEFGGRTWINSWGENNFPSGEIFTSPIEDSVNGTVAFSFPTVYGGREINGVRLTLRDGKVVEASAEKGEEFLLSQLDMDEGARTVGEIAIGTNRGIQQFVGETLFDEKIGGSIHMALGQGFEEAGGSNKSAVHWDMVHNMRDGGEIIIDGELFYRSGDFLVE